MKALKYLLALSLLALVVSGSALAHEVGNGGDAYSLEFVAIGRDTLEKLRKFPNPQISTEALARAVNEAKVVTREKLWLGDAEVDALNFPERRLIEIHRERWQKSSPQEKRALVLHEYLGLARVPDDNYQISSAYVEIPANPSPSARKFAVSVRSGYISSLGLSGDAQPSRPSYGGALSYSWNEHWRILAGLDSYQYEEFLYVYQRGDGISYRTNHLKIRLGTEFRFNRLGKFLPFLSGGLTYDTSSMSLPVSSSFGRTDYKFNYSNRAGFFLGGGITYPLATRLALQLDAELSHPFTHFNSRFVKYTDASATLGMSFLL